MFTFVSPRNVTLLSLSPKLKLTSRFWSTGATHLKHTCQIRTSISLWFWITIWSCRVETNFMSLPSTSSNWWETSLRSTRSLTLMLMETAWMQRKSESLCRHALSRLTGGTYTRVWRACRCVCWLRCSSSSRRDASRTLCLSTKQMLRSSNSDTKAWW